MRSFVQMILSGVDVVSLMFLFIFTSFFVYFTHRARSGRHLMLRPIALYEHLRQLAAQAVETGRAVHLGMGTGTLNGQGTAESLIALTVLALLVNRARGAPRPVRSTTADGAVLAAGLGILQRHLATAGHVQGVPAGQMRFYGPDPFAYAAGVHQTLGSEEHLASVLLGHFAAEGLWIAESTSRHGPPQLGGTAPPDSSALFAVSLDEMVIGEDLFAAGAYLGRPAHLGSLATQDLMRVVLVLSILVGAILTSLGYWA